MSILDYIIDLENVFLKKYHRVPVKIKMHSVYYNKLLAETDRERLCTHIHGMRIEFIAQKKIILE